MIAKYSQELDKINATLGSDITLYTNNVLSKDPYAGDGFKTASSEQAITKNTVGKKIVYLLKYFIKSSAFLILWLVKKIIFHSANIGKNTINHHELHLIDIFVLSKSIVSSEQFSDRYLSLLVDTMKKNNLNYAYLPCFYKDGYNPLSLYKLYKILKKSEHQFITEFDLLNWGDFFKMLVFVFKYPLVLLNFIQKQQTDSRLNKSIHYALENSLQDYTLLAYIRYLIGIRLAQKFNHAKLLSYCEYQVVDKCLYKGIKDNSKTWKVYAYQQFMKYDFFMNMQIPEQDKVIGIAPDKIIVTGPYFIPKKTQYNYVALAIRYQALFKVVMDKTAKNCLVLLPYSTEESINILALIQQNSIKNLYIKPHPTLNTNIIAKQYNLLTGDLYQHLPLVKIIITSVSGTALEAVSLGISVIIVSSHKGVFLNPLLDLGKGIIWDVVDNKVQLQQTYQRLEKIKLSEPDKITELANQYQHLFFTPTTEAKILASFN